MLAVNGGMLGSGTSADPLRLEPQFSYQPGNRLIFVQDAEIALMENSLAFVPMNVSSAVKGGSIRVDFEAKIQSGTDYWAWQVSVDGNPVATGAYTVSLHSSNTASVHEYRRYEIDLGNIPAGAHISVAMKACDSTGAGFGTGVDQLLYMKRFRLYAAFPSHEGGVYTAATWRGNFTNNAAIIAANAGTGVLGVIEDGNPDVFEVLTAAPGPGIRFKKAGHVSWNVDQDLVTSSTTGYASLAVIVTNDVPYYSLMGPTNGAWGNIHNGGVAQVAPGDVIKFDFGCSSCDITSMDSGSWSNVAITWLGWLDP